MKKWIVNGVVTVDVYVEVEAETLQEAMEYADSNVGMVTYANETVGADDYEGDAKIEVFCSDNIEWG